VTEPPDTVRLDKWLWAARFFKTRSAATAAVTGGKVEVNGERAKPARNLRPGDEIRLRLSPYDWELTVTALGTRRGSAAQAAVLYHENDASRRARAQLAEQLRLAPKPVFRQGRPSRRDRRQLGRLRRKS
jgi:ribosome-associated heat shock protein Hsp15